VALAAVDAAGRDIPGTACIAELTGPSLELAFHDVPEPAFVSLNRDCSFYGAFVDRSVTRETLERQIRLDPNAFNRVEAMRMLTDIERIRLIENPGAAIDEAWLAVFESILCDDAIPPGLKAYLLRIEEQSIDRRYLAWYRERHAARRTLLAAVARRCADGLRRTWDALDTYAPARAPKDGVEERRLKGVLLRTLIEARSDDVMALAEDHFHRAWSMTDRLSALTCLTLAGHPRRGALLEEAFHAWRGHVSSYTAYLQVIGAAEDEEVFDMVRREENRPCFKLSHPGHNRALYLSLGANNRMLWTERGIDWLTETVIKLAPVNENTANRLAACFQHVDSLAADLKPRVRSALQAMYDRIDGAAAPSTRGRLEAYLQGGERE
jgi:aminopeptidase N